MMRRNSTFSLLSLRHFRRFLLVGLTLFLGIAYSVPVGALTSADIKSIINNTEFYGEEEAASTCSASVTSASSGLPHDIASNIDALQSTYEKVSKQTNVPWQLLAAIHFRESNNNPNADVQAGNPFGGPYKMESTDYATYGYPTNLEESLVIAAKHLIGASKIGVVKKPINVANPDSEAVKDTLFSYNGRASPYAAQAEKLGFNSETQPYEGSPYVMNNYDAKHKNMLMISQDHGSPDTVDTRLGAFTVYSRLGGATGAASTCSSSSSGAVQGDIVKTAINYAWPDYHEPNFLTLKPAYKKAIDAAVSNNEYVGGLSHPGVDCGGFITRVMRDSGADPNYNWGPDGNEGNTTQQLAYLLAHPEKYQNLGAQTNTSNLQPGDIAINTGHTYMYVGTQSGFHGNAASASVSFSGTSWRAPMASTTYFSDSHGSFTWFRLKN